MEKFRKRILVSCIALILISGIGLSIYSNQKNNIPTVNKQRALAMYIEDESGNYQLSNSKEFPKEGYILNLEKSSCKNGGILSQNENTKGINLSVSQNDICNLYFSIEKCPKSSLYAITSLANGLKIYDGSIKTYNECNSTEMYTFDHDTATQTTEWDEAERRDYRYIGTSPNNWIKFNGEDWRIIGIFTVETSSGTKEQLIKIIRNESLGNIAWDINNINEWSTSSTKNLLNSGNYYNKTNTYKNTGLNDAAKNQIEEIKWYLGGSDSYLNFGGPDYYTFERGTTVYTGRNTNTYAKVGLMYPSDYIYTYANGVDNICYSNTQMCSSKGNVTSSWLFNNSYQWTISPFSDVSYRAYLIYDNGEVRYNTSGVSYAYNIRPTVYLKSTTKIISGDGSQNNPYMIE